MDEIHVHKTKKSICAHFTESPCIYILSYIQKHRKHLNLMSIKCLYQISYGVIKQPVSCSKNCITF